jgi:hypothetical protein
MVGLELRCSREKAVCLQQPKTTLDPVSRFFACGEARVRQAAPPRDSSRNLLHWFSKVTVPRALFAYHSLLRTITQHTGSQCCHRCKEPLEGLFQCQGKGVMVFLPHKSRGQSLINDFFLVKLRFRTTDMAFCFTRKNCIQLVMASDYNTD